ncbi:hypothetical protein DPMN_148204 [Dreissena polymorpha]|uniref:Uncharacterized protein n=1 Tax=Dreissena polymorpha TaxID=45954 RepID=A0A9D4FDK9_DREPO|nr:hypothetical protein DPMN_148204 [Dreissena polymorpha]
MLDVQTAAIILTAIAFSIQRSSGSQRSVRYYKQPQEPSSSIQDGCYVRCSVEHTDIETAGVRIASNACTCTKLGIEWLLTNSSEYNPEYQYLTKTAMNTSSIQR